MVDILCDWFGFVSYLCLEVTDLSSVIESEPVKQEVILP